MEYNLVVVRPFADYQRGDVITAQEAVQRVQAENAHHVVKVIPPAPPEQAQ